MSAKELRKHVKHMRSAQPDGTTVLESEFRQLNGSQPNSAKFRTDNAQISVNKPKNRFQNILPCVPIGVHTF